MSDDEAMAMITDRETIARLRSDLERARGLLRSARCPAVLDNASTAAWEAWYAERDAFLALAPATPETAPPGQLVRAAREVAHDAVRPWWNALYPNKSQPAPIALVDAVTAAIEARDESWNRNINANDRDWERRQARSLAAIPEAAPPEPEPQFDGPACPDPRNPKCECPECKWCAERDARGEATPTPLSPASAELLQAGLADAKAGRIIPDATVRGEATPTGAPGTTAFTNDEGKLIRNPTASSEPTGAPVDCKTCHGSNPTGVRCYDCGVVAGAALPGTPTKEKPGR